MNLKKSLLILSIFSIILISSATPASGAWDNEENTLSSQIDNLVENLGVLDDKIIVLNSKVEGLSSDLSDLTNLVSANSENDAVLREQVTSLKENISQLETSLNSVEGALNSLASENELGALENKMDNRLAAFIDSFTDNFRALKSEQENRMDALENDLKAGVAENFTELRENVSSTLAEVSATAGSFDNQINSMEDRYSDMKYQQNLITEDIGDLEEDSTPMAALGVGVLGLLAVGGLVYAIREGFFAGKVARSSEDPRDRIVEAKALLDWRLENEAAPEEIEAARTKLDTLKQRYPEEWKSVSEEIGGEEDSGAMDFLNRMLPG